MVAVRTASDSFCPNVARSNIKTRTYMVCLVPLDIFDTHFDENRHNAV